MKVPLRPLEILLVEDNPADVDLTLECFAETDMPYNVNVVNDGEAALRYLRRQGEYADATAPFLILLDLNLPRLDGREVLSEIKSDPELKHLPVLVLTSSDAEQDVITSYQLHANCYIIKPTGLAQFGELAKIVEKFWFEVAVLPPSISGRR